MDVTLTPAEMKALEAQYMRETGIPGALLMEHAAQGVCAALRRHISGSGAVLFLCGPGNNGGDGYAVARLWQAGGGRSVIAEMSDDARGDALLNRRLALEASIRILPLQQTHQALLTCDAVCDALFGTGLTRAVEGEAESVIKLVNGSGKPIVSVDIPSGLDGLNGTPCGAAICATETVTFHRIKRGLVLGESAAYTGRITVHPILMPCAYGDVEGLRCMSPEDLARVIPPRSPNAHKGTFGKVVVFAGSPGMAGAAALCARAALRAGAGIVVVLCRASILPMLQVLAPGAVCVPMEEENGRLPASSAALAEKQLASAACAVIGCGMGQTDDVLPVLECFRHATCPVVWDADALNMLAAHADLLPMKPADIITPHPGEASRLLSCSVRAVTTDALTALRQLHERCGCHVLLKGARTLMTDGSVVAVNRFGSPAMAKGGSGDVLAGMIGGLSAQFNASMNALTLLQLGALLHGLAGIRAARRYGESCVLPEHLVDAIRLDANNLE